MITRRPRAPLTLASVKPSERDARRAAREVVFDIGDLSVWYGEFRAVRDVNLPIRKNEITALIGPSGLRQDDRSCGASIG